MAIRAACRSFSGKLVLLALIATLILPPGQAWAARGGNPRYAAMIVDANTGTILHQSNADKSLYPASLTKIMTLLLAFEAIENGQLKLRDRIVISKAAAKAVPSKLDLKPGSSIRVEDAIYALVTKSANDIAIALAERIGGGSEAHFAVLMNRKAREIGMMRTNFTNASGLHNARQTTTARDMAKLARYVLNEYPQYYHYFSTRQFTYQGLTHRNHNRLMESYRGMDGFKTGYITQSGFNLVASARRGDQRLIGIVFGGVSANSRNAHMKALLDSGFDRLEQQVIMARAVPVPGRKPAEATEIASASSAAMLNRIDPAASDSHDETGFRARRVMKGAAFSEMIGEGDYDPAVSKRLETGLLAIAALKGDKGLRNYADNSDEDEARWAVQVGTFGSRAKTDRAIAQALQTLPAELAGEASPAIAPMKTRQGWLFRGRLTGLTRDQAAQACGILKDCMPVAPQSYR